MDTVKVWLAVALVVLAGCEQSPKQARRAVIKQGYSYSKHGFFDAIKKPDPEAVQLFLRAGMAPDTKVAGYTALEHGAADSSIVRLLLDAGAHPDSGASSTALLESIKKDAGPSLQILLKAGADPNSADPTGYTPLMGAADQGNKNLVQLLLDAGADPNIRSRLGNTPLGEALAKGHSTIEKLLLDAGATEGLLSANLKVLMDPRKVRKLAPERFSATFETSSGTFEVEVERAVAPLAADRFYSLIANGFFDEQRFFRTIKDKLVQFGLHGTPEVAATWYAETIADEPRKINNTKGTLCFATGTSKNSRTTQIFINLQDNPSFDKEGFVPFGRVTSGLETLTNIHAGYGEVPEQERIIRQGNAYLQKNFPDLDYIKSARLVTNQ